MSADAERLNYNFTMSTRATDYREAIDHLPEGATLVLSDVSWEDYEKLLDELADRPAVRVSYDQGKVEIITPLRQHEKQKEFIGALITVLADELNIDVESSGSTTWKRRKDQKAIEPDLCFHIGSAERVIGKDELDLDVDPPPDLAVEIDVTNESLTKFPIYATLGVPEIWRYVSKRKAVLMYELREGQYVEIPASRSFPLLTPHVVADSLEQSRTKGRTRALALFRRWLQTR